jgi:hypothetical protein
MRGKLAGWAIFTFFAAFLCSGLSFYHTRQSGRLVWAVSLISSAHAQYSCEYPPVDEPDADGDECNPNDIPKTGKTANQQNILDALGNSFNQAGGALPQNFLGAFNPIYGNTSAILNQLSGETATAGQKATSEQTIHFLSLMTDQGFRSDQNAVKPLLKKMGYSGFENNDLNDPVYNKQMVEFLWETRPQIHIESEPLKLLRGLSNVVGNLVDKIFPPLT